MDGSIDHGVIVTPVNTILFLQMFDHLGFQPAITLRSGGSGIALCTSLLVDDLSQQQATVVSGLDGTELSDLPYEDVIVSLFDKLFKLIESGILATVSRSCG